MFLSVERGIDSLFMRAAKGDPIRADQLREKYTIGYDKFIRLAFPVVIAVVLAMWVNRPAAVNVAAAQDTQTAITDYAQRYVDAYLSGPTDNAVLKQFCISDVSESMDSSGAAVSSIPPGGHSTGVSSALPGRYVNGYQTWSVIVSTQVPKSARASDTTYMPLMVDISIDPKGDLCAFSLPHTRKIRPEGKAVELDGRYTVSAGHPLYSRVDEFLSALLLGQGSIDPLVADGSPLAGPGQTPRFKTLKIESIRANSDLATADNVPAKADGIEVTVRVTLQSASGVLWPMDYPLVMSVAAGHWQVNSINDSPSIVPPSDSDAVNSTTATTTTVPPSVQMQTSAPGNPTEGS